MKKYFLLSIIVLLLFVPFVYGYASDLSCTSMDIMPNVKISCRLSVNKDAYYYYEGQKGEKVTITVSAESFIPEVDISDANGEMEFHLNEQKQNSLTVNRTLPYSGKYTFEVKTRYYTETKVGEIFTIRLASDKSNLQPDIRKDNLIEGKKYSVYELNQNQSTSSRKFLVDAYVINVYKEPPCPPEAYSCPISLTPNITIGDQCMIVDIANACAGKKSDAVLWLGTDKKYNFEILKQYQFEVSVINTSKTDVPKNEFMLVSVKNIDGNDIVNQNPPVKKSFFAIIWDWLINLFRK